MNSQIRLNKYLFVLMLSISIQACKQVTPSNIISTTNATIKTKPIAEIDSFDIKIKELKNEYNLPGISFAFIKEGKLHSTQHYGKLQKSKPELINDETMFSVGSISKFVNALVILRLVDAGQLDLDTDINQYLSDWKVERNPFTKDQPVTLKNILSHTAGFSVHGFEDYQPNESIPNLIQILNGVAPAKNKKIELMFPVGTDTKYSGGGITVSQKVVEDVTGLPYHEVAQKMLIEPLGLKRTSYENPLPTHWKNVAKAHNESGEEVALPRGYETMPEVAASGLWTSSTDLALIIIKVYASLENQSDNFLSHDHARQMITKVAPGKYGLGVGLTSHRGDQLMQHGGANDSYKGYFCFYYEKGFGYISLTNGKNGMDFIMNALKLFEDKIRDLQ